MVNKNNFYIYIIRPVLQDPVLHSTNVNKKKVAKLKPRGMGATEVARNMQIGRSTVYKILDPKCRQSPKSLNT
uniref:helix-turn-helix domain-containing protein n=1 Tax=Endozoicomonas sp. Mp262 TaxID=2919499 RepID=UPI00351B4833